MFTQGSKGKVSFIYFDNASSSRRSKYLVSEIEKVYGKFRDLEDEKKLLAFAEKRIGEFLGLSDCENYCISFVPNATYGLNELAYFFTPKQSLVLDSKISLPIYLSDSEHASNHLIWLKLSEKPISYLPIRYFEDWQLPEEKSIFSFCNCTNLEGIQIPFELIDKKFKGSNHICVVDASQSMQYSVPNLSNSPINYLVFTAHKCFGPNGIGVVYSKDSHSIGISKSNYELLKESYGFDFDSLEAWINSFDVLEELFKSGFIQREAHRLNKYFLSNFPKNNKYLKLLNEDARGLIFLLLVTDEHISAHDYSFYLNRNNVIVRSGISCSWLSGKKFNSSKLIRVSLGPFNTTEEIDIFFDLIKNFSISNCF